MLKISCIVMLVVFLTIGVVIFETTVDAVIKSSKEKGGEDVVSAISTDTNYLLFKINYVYRAGGKGEFKRLKNGDVLRSGDHYKIILMAPEDCYVYIFQVDSANKVYPLFPMKSFGGVTVNNFNPVQTGKTYYIPAEVKSFILDEQQGTEKIYFLASRERDVMLEEFYQYGIIVEPPKGGLKTQQTPSENLFLERMKSRKIVEAVSDPAETETITWQEEGRTFSVFLRHLEDMCDGCVYVLTFKHE